MKALKKLLSISSEPLSESPLIHFEGLRKVNFPESILKELSELLSAKNGFFAFENALHVFSSETKMGIPSLFEWNELSGWKKLYDTLAAPVLFFAQDLFACQFGINSIGIIQFNPESGEVSKHSETLDHWASKILCDYDFETGWSAGKEWQEVNGSLALNKRLLGKLPFVLGGEFKSSNLKDINMIKAMDKLGKLYQQIKYMPDGTKTKIRGWI